MMWIESDSERLIDMMLHQGGALSEDDLVRIEALCAKTGAAAKGRFAVSLILVETTHGPDARQRKRIADAAKKIQRCYDVLVTQSAAIRAIMTAIRWLAPADASRVQSTYTTYEQARDYLVEKTGHAPAVFDALHARLRARAKAG